MKKITYTLIPDGTVATKDNLAFGLTINDGLFSGVRVRIFDFDFSTLDAGDTFSFDYEYGDDGKLVSENLPEFLGILDQIVNDILHSALELATANI